MRKWTKESIIESIQEFHKVNGRIPSKREFTSPYPSYFTVRKYFLSWNTAIEAAGFMANKANTAWTKESIIESIQEFHKVNGRIPSARDFISPYPACNAVAYHFSSWNAGIEAAGFIPNIQKGYGITTVGKDGNLYRSQAEAHFADTFLLGKYAYDVEPKYPGFNKYYDWYIKELDLYIELDGGIRPNVIVDKEDINEELGRNLLVIPTSELYKTEYEDLNDFLIRL